MTRDEMTKIVSDELAHIPDWPGEHQANLRMVYNMARRMSLSKNPKGPRDAGGVLKHCVEGIRRFHPDAVINYDREFFGEVETVKN